jgi:integrase
METLKPYQKKIINNVMTKLNIPFNNTNILIHMNKIYQYILYDGNYATTTKRDYLIVFSLLLKNLGQQKAGDEVYKDVKQYAKIHNDNEYKQTLDENEQKNYIIYDDLFKKVQTLISVYNNKQTTNNIIKLLVLSLYVLHPPLRNDYYNMKIIFNSNDDDFKNNFLLIDVIKNNYYVIINNDKVIKNHGRGEIPITNETLKNILDIYINNYAFSNIYLFENKNGEPYTKRQIKYIINNMFKKKVLNIYNLRSAYISNYYKTHYDLISRGILADYMRHSKSTAELVYCKYL